MQEGEVFRIPSRPGKPPPQMETMLLLLIAERAWRRFGFLLVLIEAFWFSVILGVVTFALMDRTSESPVLLERGWCAHAMAPLPSAPATGEFLPWSGVALLAEKMSGVIFQRCVHMCPRTGAACSSTD